MPTKQPRIAIVGAGLAGLTLARILHLGGMAASVFEREAGPQARPQGGTPDLHEKAGPPAQRCAALRAMLLAALPERTVYWDCELRQALPWGAGCWKLALDGGGEVGPFDLVVGADGAGSRVRPLLFAHPPLPAGHPWPNRRGLTLLGDAAHAQPPFGEAGLNAALLDAAGLGQALAQEADWAAVVVRHEAAMFARMRQAAADPATATRIPTPPVMA